MSNYYLSQDVFLSVAEGGNQHCFPWGTLFVVHFISFEMNQKLTSMIENFSQAKMKKKNLPPNDLHVT